MKHLFAACFAKPTAANTTAAMPRKWRRRYASKVGASTGLVGVVMQMQLGNATTIIHTLNTGATLWSLDLTQTTTQALSHRLMKALITTNEAVEAHRMICPGDAPLHRLAMAGPQQPSIIVPALIERPIFIRSKNRNTSLNSEAHPTAAHRGDRFKHPAASSATTLLFIMDAPRRRPRRTSPLTQASIAPAPLLFRNQLLAS